MSGQPRLLFVHARIEPDFTFGVLRREFDGRTNDTQAFVHGKLHPMATKAAVGTADRVWAPTAERHEVLLPRGVPDMLVHARKLTETFEEQAVTDHKDLAVILKVTLPTSQPLHDGWEAVRGFARAALVEAHGLPVIVIMHAPFRSGTRDPNVPHIHVIAPARQLTHAGFGAFCMIANDKAHAPLAAGWAKHRPG